MNGRKAIPGMVMELANPGKVLDRCTFWRLVHSKPKRDGSGTEPINAEAESIFLELDKLEQRERLNGRELTVDVLNELFGEHFGPETRNTVRGYGLGVEWNDVPGIQINRRGVGREVASLRIELEASRTVIEKLQDETAKKDEEMQAVKAQLNGIDARLHTPLESVLSGGVDGINKLIAALTQLAGEKQAKVISHGVHGRCKPMMKFTYPCSAARIQNHHISNVISDVITSLRSLELEVKPLL
ncbi:hypothetical protein M0R45_006759 [Rubus argutus]|uniref:Uncharacterized protein n=1 Tax=Rubus argutus TaxID=59490 RepID=A0AAW1YRG5_RUBAR